MMGPQYPDGHLPYPNANIDSHRGGLTQVGMHTRYGVGHIISGSKHLDSDPCQGVHVVSRTVL